MNSPGLSRKELCPLTCWWHSSLCRGTLLAHMPPDLCQDPQDIFCKAAFQSNTTQPICGSSFPGTELDISISSAQEIPASPDHQPVIISLNSSTTFWFISTSYFCIIYKLTKEAFCPTVKITNICNSIGQCWSLRKIVCDWTPVEHYSAR